MFESIKAHLKTHKNKYLSLVALLATGGLIAAFVPQAVALVAANLPASAANLAYAATAIVTLAPAAIGFSLYGAFNGVSMAFSAARNWFKKAEVVKTEEKKEEAVEAKKEETVEAKKEEAVEEKKTERAEIEAPLVTTGLFAGVDIHSKVKTPTNNVVENEQKSSATCATI